MCYYVLQIIFSVIVALTNAIPDDTSTLDDDALAASEDTSINTSVESNENLYSPIGIFTKYPDDGNAMFVQPEIDELPDEIRMRRKINEIHSSEIVSQKSIETDGEPTKVPLRGIITAIEADLVTTALLASTQLHKQQFIEHENNAGIKNDSIDANENLFEDLFNYTRPEGQQTDDGEKMVKIPLNGLVSAVESTLINSAQNLKDTKPLQSNVNAKQEIDGLHRIDRDTSDEIVQVQSLDGYTSLQNLNILSSIALKPVGNDTELNTTMAKSDSDDDDDDDDDTTLTTEYPEVQKTNFTVIQASDTVSLVSDDKDKLAHVQHQAISKMVFQSNLPIFPTIAPKSLVIPLPTITSAEQTSKEETNRTPETVQSSSSLNATNKTEKNTKLLQKTSELREKMAEVQAPPVILSSFP